MGPAANDKNLPSRPKFTWDLRNVPWTDGRGDQEGYAKKVKEWAAFHDSLTDQNSNKIQKEQRGLVLHTQLYGRAEDRTRHMTIEDLQKESAVSDIIKCVYQRDPLTVVSDVYKDLETLLNTKRAANESFKNFESRFSAQLSKFNSHGDTARISESMAAMIFMNNASVDDAQRVSVLATCSKGDSASNLTSDSLTDDYIKLITYDEFASVIRQCDKKNANSSSNNNTLNGNNARGFNKDKNRNYSDWKGNQNSNNTSRSRRRMTVQQSIDAKKTSQCKKCNMYGHWANDHLADGKIRFGLPSSLTPINQENNANTDRNNGAQNSNNNTLDIGNANLIPAYTEFDDCDVMTCSNSTFEHTSGKSTLGPLVDDGAPYSAIGELELAALYNCKYKRLKLEELPNSISNYKYWRYGSGTHSSDSREILGCVFIQFRSKNNNDVNIRHLVIKGSSQWIIGRNATRPHDIIHVGAHELRFKINGKHDALTMVDYNRLSYIPISSVNRKINTSPGIDSLAGFSAEIEDMTSKITKSDKHEWSTVKRIVDKVHNHVCGHSTYSDMRTLLERNGFWNNAVQHYLTNAVSNCKDCIASSTPPPSRRVSLATLSREFNQVVAVDHFYLDSIRLIHFMDTVSRFSACYICESASMKEAIFAFHACWLNQFWTPESLHGDQAFLAKEFQEYISKLGITFRPVPSRRHSKNPLEPKHGVIRSIFIRLKANADEDADLKLLAMQAVTISNDLYGSDTVSSFEMAKGFTKPISEFNEPIPIPEELISAHEELKAKRKLNLILRSHNFKLPPIKIGDMVQIYAKDGNAKYGKWLSARPVISIDTQAGSVTVPGSSGKTITAAFEDTRHAIIDDNLASIISESIDKIDDSIDDLLDGPQYEVDEENKLDYTYKSGFDADFSDINENITTSINEDDSEAQAKNADNISSGANDDQSSGHTLTNEEMPQPKEGDRIQVFWPLDNRYYTGTVSKIGRLGKVNVTYDDGEKETLKLENETWKYDSNDASCSNANIMPRLQSNTKEVLQQIMRDLGNRSFLLHHASGYDQFPLVKAYKEEEEEFLKTVKRIPRKKVPRNANIIGSHTIYKLKRNDDESLKLKARIAPHGNEDSDTELLRTDCNMCSPVGVRVVYVVATIYGWIVIRIDGKTAFLQTGRASRNVYVIPPRESFCKDELWLLLTAVYGLINSNAKWQVQSDELMCQLGLVQLTLIPQLFIKLDNGRLTMIAAKVVDDIILTGEESVTSKFIDDFNAKFKLGTIIRGPGKLRFFGLQVVQEKDLSICVDGNEKLNKIEPYPISNVRRKNYTEPLDQVEKHAFMSINSSLGWLGIAASPFCALYESYLQQKLPKANVETLLCQARHLKTLKKLGTTISFPRAPKGKEVPVSVVVFSDASRTDDRGQLCYIAGLLLGPLQKDSTFYTLSWQSHRSKRPVKSTPAAEILACSEAIDEGKVLKSVFSKILRISIKLIVVVDSKDLYTSLSTKQNSIDKSIRPDVNCIRFEFETQNVDEIVWIPGSTNLADPGTKPNSPLTIALQLTMFTGRLCMDFEKAEAKSYNRSLG